MNRNQHEPDGREGGKGRRVWVGVLVISVVVVAFIVAGFFVTTTFIFRPTGDDFSPQDEAMEILRGIYDAEAVYFEAHECFEADPELLGFRAKKPRYYSWAIVRAGCGGYAARAWGNLDDDDALDIWEITDHDEGRPMHVFSDEFDRGYAIDPESEENWRPTDGVLLPPAGRRD